MNSKIVRLINANMTKEAIELLCKDERTNMTAITYFVLLDLLDTMPTIEAERANGWISVKDRLPDDDKLVLVYTEDGVMSVCSLVIANAFANLKNSMINNYKTFCS